MRCRRCGWRGRREEERRSTAAVKDRESRHPMTNRDTMLGAFMLLFMIIVVIGLFIAISQPTPGEQRVAPAASTLIPPAPSPRLG